MRGGFARWVVWHSLRERDESSVREYSSSAFDDRDKTSTISLADLLSVEIPPVGSAAADACDVPIARPST
jgi:hypothetical protein